ncbi:hypothetical protein TBLA_0B01620 [Henningerozyma blattae CBS 6284]|uniref:PH domain-containing protein n=1 Tax=Henningerozyma blattae (strain ATCC 34711 / CBS 6284 / DSM 70876 / NBRC 10599 / NRRL Y-10934 / UCD 77-7) TaxID=1071380 RepID=I2GY03_HENB6|nr:hypothetical protein TBLA_0B01620 [Tetrapisispora blattae CBS 6284]CCH59005.1 hypothetical protein TBLA_0B01620 [Tetrapisispora blattae CBS 6284]
MATTNSDAGILDVAPTLVSKPLLKLKLLESLRQNDFEKLRTLLDTQFNPWDNADVQDVASLLLHYSVQVAPLSLIKEIVNKWVDQIETSNNSTTTNSNTGRNSDKLVLQLNYQDHNGNTPLHLAALQLRVDVVSYLLDQPSINDCVLNHAHLQPIQLCKNVSLAQIMQMRRSTYVIEIAQEFRTAFNNRDFQHLESILSKPRNLALLDINGMDPATGDTVLHEFVKKRDVQMCEWLLSHGADPFKRDRFGKLPTELLRNVSEKERNTDSKAAIEYELKKLLDDAVQEQSIIDVTSTVNQAPTLKGYLHKWTNFAQGYKLRWFVLSSDGTLSYYIDQEDTRNACRGSLNVSTCSLHLDSSENLKFEIIGGNNGTVSWHLKGNHPIETNRWVWAIQGSIRYAKDREKMENSIRNNVIHSPSLSMSNKFDNMARSLSSHSIQSQLENSQNLMISNNNDNSTATISHNNNNRKTSLTHSIPSIRQLSPEKIMKNQNDKNNTVYNESQSDKVPLLLIDNENNENNYDNRDDNNTPPRTPISNVGQFSHILEDIRTSATIKSKRNKKYTLDGEDNISEHSDDDDDETESIIMPNDEMQGNNFKEKNDTESQKLNILQRTISMQLSLLTDLLKDKSKATVDTWATVDGSLMTISSCFKELKTLVTERDRNFLSLINKQLDVNEVWIQSVKDLEEELINKSERLAKLENERRDLRKLINKTVGVGVGIGGGGDSGVNNTHGENVVERSSSTSLLSGMEEESGTKEAINQVAKLIEATKLEDEESDTDEFFDAEDLDEEQESAGEDGSLLGTGLKLDDSKMVSTVEAVEEENEEGEGEGEGEGEVEGEGEGETCSNEYHTINPQTQLQKDKELEMLEDKTFSGYEDGIRHKLSLDEDNRPVASLWSVLKSMVGKDITKIALPVSFNEPTSLLQRVTEDLEYSELLDQAASFEDSSLRMLYVAVFSLAAYSSTPNRVAKPFNPLLGETFEYCRSDKHFRFLSEQVSHHPPITAFWSESPKWEYWGESFIKSNFNGRAFKFNHMGMWHIKIRPDYGGEVGEEIYTWMKPENTLVGILIGKPEIDCSGEVKITNHSTGDYCLLNYKARGWRANDAYEVRGEVFNVNDEKKWMFGGHWNDCIYGKREGGGEKFLIWKVKPRPVGPFNLTSYAISLNNINENLKQWIAPTDSRLRPDQRAMEDGEYDLAADEKFRLETKQREVRKKREENDEKYEPRWFVKDVHPATQRSYWRFKNEYWKRRKTHDFHDCAALF